MRNVLLFLAVFFAFAANAQTVAKQEGGNYIEANMAADSASLTKNATLSAAKFKAKDGNTYQVFLSANGKTFIIKKSAKSSKWYRRYFTVIE